MEKAKIIRGTETEIWDQVKEDMNGFTYPLIYHANIMENDKTVFLNIQSDAGEGSEPGYESTNLMVAVPVQFTSLSAKINQHGNFRFALHHEDFIDKVGKFFGMADGKTGYTEFDKKLVVKTNDIKKVKSIFSGEAIRKTFESLRGFNLHTTSADNNDKYPSLELTLERDIVNAEELYPVYKAFVAVLAACEATEMGAGR